MFLDVAGTGVRAGETGAVNVDRGDDAKGLLP
jgi:hypothetical protein